MTLPATDAFTGTGALSGSWTNGVAGYARASDVAQCSTLSTDVVSYWNADSFSNDQYSKATINGGLLANTNYVAVCARMSGTGATVAGYQVTTDGSPGAGHTVIQRWNTGSVSDLKAVATSFANGDVLEIRVSGSSTVNVALYKNGVLADSFDDSSGSRIASGGAAGIGGFVGAANISLDTWEGGNLGAASGVLRRRALSGGFENLGGGMSGG